MTDVQELAAFFAAHFGGPLLDGEMLELRALPPNGGARHRDFFTDYEAAARCAAKYAPTHNIFFGVNPRKGRNGTKHGVSRIVCLHADVDFKHFGDDEENAFEAIFDALPEPQPARIVHSGGGYQAYWNTNPVPANADNVTFWESVMAALCRGIGNVDPLFDVSRIFRVPGTLNYKYDPPRRARMVYDAASGPVTALDGHWLLDAYPEPRKPAPARPQHRDEEGEEWTVDKVADLLAVIPPTLGRKEWQEIVFAVHSVLPDEGGFLAVDEWSSEAREENGQTCSLRADPALWDRIRRDDAEGAVSVGSLIHRAQEYGWAPKPAFHMVDRREQRAHEEEERRVREELAERAEYAPLTREEMPHWLGVLVDYLQPTTRTWREDWAEGLALTALSSFFPNMRLQNLGVNLWWLGIAKQSTGKSRGGDEMEEVVDGLAKELGARLGFLTEATPEGYAVEHQGEGTAVYAYHTEYVGVLKAFKREHMTQAKETLNRLYDGGKFRYRRSRDVVEGRKSHSVIVATTTAASFLTHAEKEDIQSGYLARFWVCFPERHLNVSLGWRNERERRNLIRDLVPVLRERRELTSARFVLPAFWGHQEPPALIEYERKLGMNDGREFSQQDVMEEESALPAGRVLARAKKVAVLLSLLEATPRVDEEGALIVSDERVAQAIRLVQRGAMQAGILVKQMGGSQDARFTEKIVRFLRDRPNGETQRKIVAGVAGLEYKVCTPILKGLVDDGEVRQVNTGRTVLYALGGK